MLSHNFPRYFQIFLFFARKPQVIKDNPPKRCAENLCDSANCSTRPMVSRARPHDVALRIFRVKGRNRPSRFQPLVHHKRIDQPRLGMIERLWQTANRVKSQIRPKVNRPDIRRHHKIELHSAIAQLDRLGL